MKPPEIALPDANRCAQRPLMANLTRLGGRIYVIGLSLLLARCVYSASPQPAPVINIWHGEFQRVGHLGDAQDDFNLVGHIEPFGEIETFSWKLGSGYPVPLSFRAYRRLVEDGDFNADIPIGMLKLGTNIVKLTARFRDGRTLEQTAMILKGTGAQPLPIHISWAGVTNMQDVGQIVDGRWAIEKGRLRTKQIGYDRAFLIGDRGWRDYEVRASLVIHEVSREFTDLSGGRGLGFIFHFCGHSVGGPRHFASGQPKWGYQPFGAIAWLRWGKGQPDEPPLRQFYSGDSDSHAEYGRFDTKIGQEYSVRLACETLPNDAEGRAVTRYSFKIWAADQSEPATWDWQQTQASATALTRGGLALLAHHVDASFGNIEIIEKP